MNTAIQSLTVIAVLLLSSCSQHIANFSAISTRNVSVNNVDLTKLPQRKVTGVDSIYQVGIFFTGILSMQDAVEDALRKGEGDILLDASLTAKWYYFIFTNVFRYEITGTVVNTKAANP